MGLEILAILFGLIAFAPVLAGRAVRIWTDNEGCAWSMMTGGAKCEDHNWLVHRVWSFCFRNFVTPWFCRVPSADNISDGPTRNDYAVVNALGACHVSARVPPFE